MKIKEVIGIDISKLTNEASIHTSQLDLNFENNKKGFKKLITWVQKNTKCKPEEIMYSFEHTGMYSFQLALFLTEKQYQFIIIPGLEIKRSLGIQRGKNDKVDAKRIALYAYRRKDEIKPYVMPSKELTKIRQLLSLRDKLVKHRAGYMATLQEQTRVLVKKDNKVVFAVYNKMILELDKQIGKVEVELNIIISENPGIKKMYDLITSIKGVGPQTALYMIVLSNGFLSFKNSRKFASYAGIAPFQYQSGTSIKGKTKVSHLANKKIKTLLSSCATSAIRWNPEMKAYYNRKLEEGKHEMSINNAVRNKILSRIFAVVNRGTPYINTFKFAS